MEATRSTLGILSLLLGLTLLAFGAREVWETGTFLRRAASATGTVLSIEVVRSRRSGHRPLVRFQIPSGEEFVFRGRAESRQYAVGATVPVLYDPKVPIDARLDSAGSLWRPGLFLGGAALLVTIFAALRLLEPHSYARRTAELRRRGTPVQARRTAVKKYSSDRVLFRTPWRITCEWRDPSTQKTRTFVSRPIWIDPAPYLRGEAITVYVDRENPRRYVVDLSFLPRSAGW